ncbi:hypothetical protein ABEB36_004081 [Hypothenemus hampei]|uniref:Uncharacterized protein n=1 Tax=Hypothenemus hampei TaxID=57062 RepID=A0ABD1F269_HYPHA
MTHSGCKVLRDPESILRTMRNHNLKLKSWSSWAVFKYNQVDDSLIYGKFGNLIQLQQLNLSFYETAEQDTEAIVWQVLPKTVVN